MNNNQQLDPIFSQVLAKRREKSPLDLKSEKTDQIDPVFEQFQEETIEAPSYEGFQNAAPAQAVSRLNPPPTREIINEFVRDAEEPGRQFQRKMLSHAAAAPKDIADLLGGLSDFMSEKGAAQREAKGLSPLEGVDKTIVDASKYLMKLPKQMAEALGLPSAEQVEQFLYDIDKKYDQARGLKARPKEAEGPISKTAASIGQGAGQGAVFGPWGMGAGAVGAAAKEGALAAGVPEEYADYIEALAPLAFDAGKSIAKKTFTTGNKTRNDTLKLLMEEAGLSEEQAAKIILASENPIHLKTGGVGQKSVEELKKTQGAIGESMERQYESSKKLPTPTEGAQAKFEEEVRKTVDRWKNSALPTETKEALIKKGEELLQKLEKGHLTPETIIDTWRDVRQWEKAGAPDVNKIKEPLFKALESTDPAFAKNFKELNEFYAKASSALDGVKNATVLGMSPNKIVNIGTGAGAIYGLAYGAATGDYSYLKYAVGAAGLKKAIAMAATSPRIQSALIKLGNASKTNSPHLIKKTLETINKDFEKEFEMLNESD